MIYSNPGTKAWYPSYCCSPWYCWFVELGYPRLDINQYPDGEFEIIEYYSTPIIPPLTKWNQVLYGIRNTEISRGFVTKYIHQLDLHRKQVWDEAEARTRAMEDEKDGLERHAQDTAERAFQAIRGNADLMERVAKNGMSEINPENIWRHIPRHQKITHTHKATKV